MIPGSPSYLRWVVGNGVSEAYREDALVAVDAMHHYLVSMESPPVEGDVILYLYEFGDDLIEGYARETGWSLEASRRHWEGGSTAVSGDGWIFVNVSAPWYAGAESKARMKVLAHELLHTFQHGLSGLNVGGAVDTVPAAGPRWLSEGIAEYLAYRALSAAGLLTYESERDSQEPWGFVEQAKRVDNSLEEMETWTGFSGAQGWPYKYSLMAAELLAAESSEASLIRYYTLTQPGTSWKEAFEDAFGINVEIFYAKFEVFRDAGFPRLRAPRLSSSEVPTPEPTDTATLEPTGTPEPSPNQETLTAYRYASSRGLSSKVVLNLHAGLGDGVLDSYETAYIDLIADASEAGLREAMSVTPLIQDGEVSEADLEVIRSVSEYHPRLAAAVLEPVPEAAAHLGFITDGVLSSDETDALRIAQAVFGLPSFYRAWALENLESNEVQAILSILTFYDPFTTLHDVTANPDDQGAMGTDLNRMLDAFEVYRGECLYCRGQRYFQSYIGEPRFAGHETKERESTDTESVEWILAFRKEGVVIRNRLLHIAHHAKLQADGLSPCDLAQFTEVDLVALGATNRVAGPGVLASTILTQAQVDAATHASTRAWVDSKAEESSEKRRRLAVDTLAGGIGNLFSPFTHAANLVGPVEERGLRPCREAAVDVLEWLSWRYVHFLGYSDAMRVLFLDSGLFPQNPFAAPAWAHILAFESGNKYRLVIPLMRSMNIPVLIYRELGLRYNSSERELQPLRYPSVEPRNPGVQRLGDLVFPAFHANIHHNFGYPYVYGTAGIPFDRESLLNKLSDDCQIGLTGAPWRALNGLDRLRLACSAP